MTGVSGELAAISRTPPYDVAQTPLETSGPVVDSKPLGRTKRLLALETASRQAGCLMPHTFRDCNNAGAKSALIESQAAQEFVRLVANLALRNRILSASLAEIRVGHSAA